MKSWCFRDNEEIGKYFCSYCLLNHRKEKLVRRRLCQTFQEAHHVWIRLSVLLPQAYSLNSEHTLYKLESGEK